MLRDTSKARASFEKVIALEHSDGGACADLLARALARYPDFPEAKVLLDSLSALAATLGRQPELRGPQIRRGPL